MLKDELKNQTDNLVEIFHELKNPLSTVKVNIELLKEYEHENYSKSFDIIENEIDKMNNIIRRYLSFTNQKTLEKDQIYFSEVIQNIIDENKKTYNEIYFDLNDDFDTFILAYEYHIYMIFSNIIKNAIEAVNGVGKIHIKITEKDGMAQIEIIDDGSGITNAQIKKINEGFYTSKPNGNGIGTAIIRNTVKIYDGEFYLINREIYDGCNGTVAVVRIPLHS